MLIGLTGKARSGKDTLGMYLARQYHMDMYAFAAPIKDALKVGLGLTDAELNGVKKEYVHTLYQKTPRQMMQWFGTDFARNMICQDVWLKRAEMQLQQSNHLVITDVRFENEAEWVRERGGYVVHLIRPDAATVNEHISEAGVEYHPYDFTIYNTGDIPTLFTSGDALIRTIKENAA